MNEVSYYVFLVFFHRVLIFFEEIFGGIAGGLGEGLGKALTTLYSHVGIRIFITSQ